MNKNIAKIGRYINRKLRKEELDPIIEIATYDKIEQSAIRRMQHIGIVCPAFVVNSGGMTSIIRIGVYLVRKGMKVTYVIYNTSSDKTITELKKTAKLNNKEFNEDIVPAKEAFDIKFDICIATSWQSVYYAKKMHGYKVYFIQDFEPYFYPIGEEYYLAKKTYELGFHMVCLGRWNKEQIIRNCCLASQQLDTIDFPYEPSEYPFKKREFKKYEHASQYSIAAYIKGDGRRIPNIIQNNLYHAEAELLKRGIKLNVYYFGLGKQEHVKSGENLGTLSRRQLYELYCKCDFGIVASLTNISLIPYEMISSGLPIFEFKEGSFPSFLGEDVAFLVDFDYKSIVNTILSINQDASVLCERQDNARKKMKSISWDKTCAEFYDVLRASCKENSNEKR